MRIRRHVACLAALLGLAAIGLAPGPCAAQTEESGNLQEVIHSAAEGVLQRVKDQPVSVGQITPTGLPDANGGPAIAELLKAELESLRAGCVRRVAPFEVKGDFNLAPHPDRAEAALGQKVVRVVFRVINTTTGEEDALRLTRLIRDNSSILRILTVTTTLPLDPEKDQREQKRQRNRAIQEHVAHPKTFVDPAHRSLVSSHEGSPYQVEILAGPPGDGRVRPTGALLAEVKDGNAFVNVDRGRVYEVRVHNASPEEVAVRVFIDGLDVFHFSDDRDPSDPKRPRFSHWIVPPASGGVPGVTTVAGWHKSVSRSPSVLAFLVTAYGQGASSQAGIPATGPIGVIQVQFSRCYPRTPGQKRGASNETGFGPPRDIRQQAVEREIEPPIDAVSVRYTR